MKTVLAILFLWLDLCGCQFDAGHLYRIKREQFDLHVTVKDYSENPSAILVQENSNIGSADKQTSQCWHLLPVDEKGYLIANYRSGLLMGIKDNSFTDGASIEQNSFQTIRRRLQTSQIWTFIQTGSSYYVKSLRGFRFLGVTDDSSVDGAQIQQETRLGIKKPHLKWSLVLVKPFDKAIRASLEATVSVDDLDKVNPTTSLKQSSDTETDSVLLGVVIIPFPLINDTWTPKKKSVLSPYYILRRYGYWELVSSTPVDESEKRTVTVGLTTGVDADIQRVVGIHVTDKATFRAKPFVVRLFRDKLESGLKVKVTGYGVLGPSSVPKEVKQANLWFRADRYELQRMDGTEILKWTTRDPKKFVVV